MNKIHSAIGDHLRSRTRLAHAAVDRHSVLRPLMSPGISCAEYATALASLHALYATLEPCMAEGLVAGRSHYPFHPRCALLNADLQALGHTPFPDQGYLRQALPASVDEAIGVLYVLEGSRLGGKFILENLRKTAAGLPMDFFSDHGNDPAVTWAAFHQLLAVEQEDILEDRAASAAVRLFDALLKHLDACQALSP